MQRRLVPADTPFHFGAVAPYLAPAKGWGTDFPFGKGEDMPRRLITSRAAYTTLVTALVDPRISRAYGTDWQPFARSPALKTLG